jgi:hypothetical protein
MATHPLPGFIRRSEDRGDRTQGPSRSWSALLIPGIFVALPPILFYTILFSNSVNLPLLDDYDALLSFLNKMAQLDGLAAKASFFLSAQHNEYKLFFMEGVSWLQIGLCGHVDLAILSAIGNGFVLLLGILLWKMFLPNQKDLATRLTLFIPVSWLVFQLKYWETLNWAMAGLQNIPVVVFSLGAIYLLLKPTRRAFGGASIVFCLAVSSSGNGLFLIPIGLLILALTRQRTRLGLWLVASGVNMAVYAYGYNVLTSQADAHRSVIAAFHPLHPILVLFFIGSAASIPFGACGLLLGIFLCLFFAYLAWTGYIRRNPLVSACVLFLLVTAIGVAGLRSGLGIQQILTSRYSIYSLLFLVFAWFAIAEEFLQFETGPLLQSNLFLLTTLAIVLLSLLQDVSGWSAIRERNGAIVEAMAEFEHPTHPESAVGPTPTSALPEHRALAIAFNLRARQCLLLSRKLGIYQPPDYSVSKGP